MSEKPVKRRYDSPARRAAAEATRERICAAAEALFTRDGYSRTSIRAVAARAGVSEGTVYLAFSDKPALLDATILRAIRESGSEPLSVLVSLPPGEILPRAVASTAAVMRHAGRLIAIGESAALMDAELRPYRDRAYARLRAALRGVADALAEHGLLRPGLGAAAAGDTLYAIANPTTYLRMVEDCGLPPERYAGWLTGVLTSTLTTPAAAV
jgi:AcrR family transcriptional regulator